MQARGMSLAIKVFAVTLLSVNAWAQASETLLYEFGGSDGSLPNAGVIFDKAGNIYGTTENGGAIGFGTAFELTPSKASWVESVLHSFTYNNGDGGIPQGVVVDKKGNLYGPTEVGGTNCNGGCGTVFELSDGTWSETLFSFNGSDGQNPSGPIVLHGKGKIYGATARGGVYSGGVVFQISLSGHVWTEKPIYFFGGANDGNSPNGGLVFDKAGNLYGTTEAGGTNNYGMVFELSPSKNGLWAEKVLYSFTGFDYLDGAFPVGGVTFDKAGNVYGLTYGGGNNNVGTVFKLTTSNGSWAESVLYSFNSNGFDGNNPVWNLAVDPTGHLYGATYSGGAHGRGTVFKLSKSKQNWTEKVVYSFCSSGSQCADGASPEAGVIFHAGDLFGTTSQGGVNNNGVVYQIHP